MTPAGGFTRSARLARRWAVTIAGITAVLVWNLVFDLWLGQAERQYLWGRAKQELGRDRGVSLEAEMASSIAAAVWVATAWAAIVAGAILLAAYLSFRLARREK